MDKAARETPYYYYASHGSLVCLVPHQGGVRIGIHRARAGDESDSACLMSLDEFRCLLDDADKVIAEVARLKRNATTYRKDND